MGLLKIITDYLDSDHFLTGRQQFAFNLSMIKCQTELRIKRKTIFEGYLLLIIAQQECGFRFLKYRSELDRFFIVSTILVYFH